MSNCCFKVFDNIDEGIVLLNENSRIVYWNQNMVNVTRISKGEALDKKICEVLPKFKEETFNRAFKITLENNQKFFFSSALHKKFIPTKSEFCEIRQNLKVSSIYNEDQKYILMEFIDVTGEYLRITQMKNYIKNIKELKENLQESEMKYRLLFENMDRGFLHTMIVTDDEGKLKDLKILDTNEIMLEELGLEKVQILQESAVSLFRKYINRKRDLEKILHYAEEGKTLKMEALYIRELKKIVQISGYSSGLDTYGFIIMDITEQKKNEEIIKKLAYFDHLTSLYNRDIFTKKAEKSLELAKEEGLKCALMILDLDNFKNINDSYGHYVGDVILRTTSTRIIKNIRKIDLAGRYGGDELLILMANVSKIEDINNFANRIIFRLKQPISIEEKIIYPSISMGISVFPNDGDDVERLLIRADKNLYRVKHEGGGSYRI